MLKILLFPFSMKDISFCLFQIKTPLVSCYFSVLLGVMDFLSHIHEDSEIEVQIRKLEHLINTLEKNNGFFMVL